MLPGGSGLRNLPDISCPGGRGQEIYLTYVARGAGLRNLPEKCHSEHSPLGSSSYHRCRLDPHLSANRGIFRSRSPKRSDGRKKGARRPKIERQKVRDY